MGPANFNDLLERLGLLVHGIPQLRKRGYEGLVDFDNGSNVHSSGEAAERVSIWSIANNKGTDVSLLLWLMLTWSFGWTGVFEPSSPPRISMARFEMT